MVEVIFVNGPKRAGKTSLIQRMMPLAEEKKGITVHHIYISEILIETLEVMFDLPKEQWRRACVDFKDRPCRLLPARPDGGHPTPREMMVWLSEECMKPMFGQDVFGHITVNRMGNILDRAGEEPQLFLVDVGFADEARPVVWWAGKDACTLVHVHRDGFAFNGEARHYIDPHLIGLDREALVVNNNGDGADSLTEEASRILAMVVGT